MMMIVVDNDDDCCWWWWWWLLLMMMMIVDDDDDDDCCWWWWWLLLMMMIVLYAFCLISDCVSFVWLIQSVTFPPSAIGPWSALPLFVVCFSSVRNLLFLCSKFALPLFGYLWVSLSPLNNSLTLHFLLSPSTLGIWGKQDGTSNCAWGGRGRHCSFLVSRSPQPPPRCHTSLPLSFQLISKTVYV